MRVTKSFIGMLAPAGIANKLSAVSLVGALSSVGTLVTTLFDSVIVQMVFSFVKRTISKVFKRRTMEFSLATRSIIFEWNE